jgi:methionyl-tRNA formyltransferase
MMSYLFLSEKKWHDDLFTKLKKETYGVWHRIQSNQEFTKEGLKRYKVDKIFIPHWSHIIPAEIYEKYECIVFHMTDLPFGRGGSPLQNLIIRGFKESKISALKVEKGIDTGPIYLKRPIILSGTAEEIFLRANPIILEMIKEILRNKICPTPQVGRPFVFKRRKPNEGNLAQSYTLKSVYDMIRMLDCVDYPNAFIETDKFKFEFEKAKFQKDNILANVRITKK